MSLANSGIVPLDSDHLVERLRAAAERLGIGPVDVREIEHLVRVVTRCSALLDDVYTDQRLQAILVEDPRRLTGLVTAPWLLPLADADLPPALARLRRLPNDAREVGDQALFDLAITQRGPVRGVPLDDLGPRAYRLAADVLELLAADARLREHFANQGLPADDAGIEREVGFLRRCSDRFNSYSRMLRLAGEIDDGGDERRRLLVPEARQGGAIVPLPSRALELLRPDEEERPAEEDAAPGPVEESLFAAAGADTERLVGAYERLLLFAGLDLESLHEELSARVVDQAEAIDTLLDDFALFAVGTQSLTRPTSYFLVGPTGVGKNYLVETLVDVLGRRWGVEIPLLTIEGPSYTYPSDINELRGATRGFIRSDEPGLLTDFHDRASAAPLSVILVDEVEKAHPQLRKFFLSILDRGVTTDAHGHELHFAGCLVFFTSNIGFAEGSARSQPIGFGDDAAAASAYRAELTGSLKRTLSPEFINRVKIVRFNHIPRSSAAQILELEFERIADRYRRLHGIELDLAPAGRERILDEGYSHEYGARHLSAVLQRTCNVEVGKLLRRDELRETGAARDPQALLVLVRDIRAGQAPIGLDELERRVVEQARAQVSYRRIIVDAEDGRLVYRRER
jgi:hypothetical protein